MRTIRNLVRGACVLVLPAMLNAQATTRHAGGTETETKSQMTGQVLWAEGNSLVVWMQPGEIRTFNVAPGRQFMIDGQVKMVGDLKPGTMLNATITTKKQDVRARTLSVVKGTVWFVQGNTVILTLENGENRQFNVEDSFKFTMDGQPATVKDLKKGAKVVGTKMVEEPETVITTDVAVTGKAPK